MAVPGAPYARRPTRDLRGMKLFSPWIGFAVFCSYAAAAMTVGLVLFLRRDA
jgi:hypothetical protein